MINIIFSEKNISIYRNTKSKIKYDFNSYIKKTYHKIYLVI